MELHQWKYLTPVGPLYLVVSSKGLCEARWKKASLPLEKKPQGKILNLVIKQLDQYFEGKRVRFKLPLDLSGSDFQQKVWSEVAKIPLGETRTYLDIALKLKNKSASRAVGSANGQNPLNIIIPCHRLITSRGTLGGYAGGLSKKEHLLRFELGEKCSVRWIK
jgi:methylated-DNA-[protein]-cysteine S-methyltransferase